MEGKSFFDEKEFHRRNIISEWLQNASIEELNSRTVEEWLKNLIEYETGFYDIFSNPELILMETSKLLSILEIMKYKKQRFMEIIYYEVLLFPKEIREWVKKNLVPSEDNELYIKDNENY